MPVFRPLLKKIIIITLIAFGSTSFNIPLSMSGEVIVPLMPAPGTMVDLSPAFTPAYLTGMTVHPNQPFKFQFLVHQSEGSLTPAQKDQEYTKLIKYFLASLTVPDKDQWVNLSPYEKDRIIEKDLGGTTMGRDLLAQDYLLKQVSASMMYPEKGLGKDFWNDPLGFKRR